MANVVNNQTNNKTKRHIEGEENHVANSRVLYEEVIRKNQEIIKQILSKINDLYNKQEDLDCNMRTINEKIMKVNESTQQLHHQFRANHIEIERKHQGFINDINSIKGILKIPDLNSKHDDYLQSDFFKQNSALVSMRSRPRGKKRYKTNFKLLQDAANFIKGQKGEKQGSCELNGKSKRYSQLNIGQKVQSHKDQDFFQHPKKNQFSITIGEGLSRVCKEQDYKDSTEVFIDQKITQLQQKLQFSINNSKDQMKMKQMQYELALQKIQSQIQSKFEKISKNLHSQKDWSHINFQQLQNYLSGKIKDQLHQKLSKKYFEESMINLKESWQEELDKMYELINTKLDQQTLQAFDNKISELRSQQQLFNHLNSMKLQHFSYNSTCKSTPQRFGPTQRNTYADSFDNIRYSRQSEETKTLKKNELLYSNSCSSFSRTKEFKKIHLQYKDCIGKSDEESVTKWKNRVVETLGLSRKKVRRIKRSDQFNK